MLYNRLIFIIFIHIIFNNLLNKNINYIYYKKLNKTYKIHAKKNLIKIKII